MASKKTLTATERAQALKAGYIDLTKTGPLTYRQLQQLNNKLPDESSEFYYNDDFTNSQKAFSSGTSYKEIPVTEQEALNSIFDKGLYNPAELEDKDEIRANAQSSIAKIGAGLTKGVTTAATTFLNNTAGLLWGAASAIYTGEFNKLWNNGFTNAMQDFSDWTEKVLPNYYTKDEQENPMSHLLSANFIGDKLIKNLGFVVGSIYSGNIYSAAVRGIGMATARGIMSGMTKFAGRTASRAMVKGAINATNAAASATATFLNAVGESSLEALGMYREFKDQHTQEIKSDIQNRRNLLMQQYTNKDISREQYINELNRLENVERDALNKVENSAIEGANRTFALNMPMIWGADAIMYGKLFKNKFSVEKQLAQTKSKFIKRNDKYDLSKGYKDVLTNKRKIWELSKGPLSEAAQEWGQEYATNLNKDAHGKDVMNYYKASIDGRVQTDTINWMEESVNAFLGNFNQQSTEAFLLGGLTSLVGAPTVAKTTNKKGEEKLRFKLQGNIISEWRNLNETKQENKKKIDAINARLQSPKFKQYWKNKIRHDAIQEDIDASIENNDKFSYENALNQQQTSDIELFDNIGALDDLKQSLKQEINYWKRAKEEDIQELLESSRETIRVSTSEEITAEKADTKRQIEEGRKELAEMEENLSANIQRQEELSQKETLTPEEETELKQLEKFIIDYSDITEEIQSLERYLNTFEDKVISQFEDENGNQLSNPDDIKAAIVQRGQKLLENIDLYSTVRQYINRMTNNELSTDGSAFLTNIEMARRNADSRITDILDFLARIFRETDLMNLIIDEDTFNDYDASTIRSFYEKLRSVEPKNKEKQGITYYQIAKTIFNNPKLVEALGTLLRYKTHYSAESIEKITSRLTDLGRLYDRSSQLKSTLDHFLENPKLVQDKINKDLDEAITKTARERKQAALDRINSEETTSFDAIRQALIDTTDEEGESILQESSNKKAQELLRLQATLTEALSNLSDSEEDEAVKELLRTISLNAQSIEDVSNYLENTDNISTPEDKSNPEEVDSYEKALLTQQRALSIWSDALNAVNSSMNNKVDKKIIDGYNPNIPSESNAGNSGKDGNTKVDDSPQGGTNTPLAASSNTVTIQQIVEANEKNSSAPVATVPKTSYIRTTRELIRGMKYGDNYDEAVDKHPTWSPELKKKMKLVHNYLVQSGAYLNVNRGFLSMGQKVCIISDRQLNEEVGHTVLLLALKTQDSYAIIGDLPVLEIAEDKEMAANYAGLEALINEGVKRVKASQEKSVFIDTGLTSSVNQLYIGQLPLQSDKRTTVAELFREDSAPPIIGVMGANNQVLTNGILSPSEIQQPLTHIPGCVCLLIPNGRKQTHVNSYNVAYVKISPYDSTDTNEKGLAPIIDNCLRDILSARSQSELGQALGALSTYVHAELHADLLSNNQMQLRVGKQRTIISLDNIDQALSTIKQIIHGSPMNVKIDSLGTELEGVPFEKRLAYHLTTELQPSPILQPTTVDNWFSINGVDENFKEIHGETFKTLGINPAQVEKTSTERTKYSVGLFGKTFIIDTSETKWKVVESLPNGAIGAVSSQMREIVIAELYTWQRFGDLLNSVDQVNGVCKLGDRLYDRKNHTFITTQSQQKTAGQTLLNVPQKQFNKPEEIVEDILANTKKMLPPDKITYSDIHGNKYLRVTVAIQGLKDIGVYALPSTTIGNMIDNITRMFFDGKLKTPKQIKDLLLKYKNIGNAELTALIQQLQEFKDKNPDLTFIPQDVTLTGYMRVAVDGKLQSIPVAGTLDLLAYDKEGNWYIFDMKTKRNGNIKKADREKWALQLNAYADLLQQNYGVKVKSLQILPFSVSYTDPLQSKFSVNKLGTLLKDNKVAKGIKPRLMTQAIVPSTRKSTNTTKEVLDQIDQFLDKKDKQNTVKSRANQLLNKVIQTESTSTEVSTQQLEATKQAPIKKENVLSQQEQEEINNIPSPPSENEKDDLNTDDLIDFGEQETDKANLDDNQKAIDELRASEKLQKEIRQKAEEDLDNSLSSSNEGEDQPLNTDDFIELGDDSDNEEVGTPPQEAPMTPVIGTITDFNDDPDLFNRLINDDNTEEQDLQTELMWLQSALPNLSRQELIRIQEGLYNTPSGQAYGQFKNGIIYLSTSSAKGTLFHEAFHSVFHTLMSKEERLDIYSLAVDKWGNIGAVELEEALAEDFRQYVQDEQYGSPIRKFWKKLWHIIKTLGGRINSLDSIYYNINKGKYGGRTQVKANYATRYRIISNIPSNTDIALLEDLKTFFKNFDISIEEIEDFDSKESLFDAVNRVIYGKSIEDITDTAGYAVAFMMQHSKEIQELVAFRERIHSTFGLKGLRRATKTGSLITVSTRDAGDLIDQETLKDIGKDIAYELRKLYDKENRDVPETFTEKIWRCIEAFFAKFNYKNRVLLSIIKDNTKTIAQAIKLNDPTIIKQSTKKPGTKESAKRVSIEEALDENPYEESILNKLSKYDIYLAGSASIAISGIVMRPPEGPLHDLDFETTLSKNEIEKVLDKEFHYKANFRTIQNDNVVTESYIILDRPFKLVNGELIDIQTEEKLGVMTKFDLILQPGVQGKVLDFFIKNASNYSPITYVLNGLSYKFSDPREALTVKVQWQRAKDIFDYNNYMSNISHRQLQREKAVQRIVSAMKSRNAQIVWGHPAIGKTTYLQTHDDILEWDEIVNPKRDIFIKNQIDPYNTMDDSSSEYRELRQQYVTEWRSHPEYIQFLTEEWNKLVKRARAENKKLFASPTPLLEIGAKDIDLAVALPRRTFIQNNTQRGGNLNTSRAWKNAIDESLSKMSKEKVIYTEEYFSDFMDEIDFLSTTNAQEIIKDIQDLGVLQDQMNEDTYDKLRRYEEMFGRDLVKDVINNKKIEEHFNTINDIFEQAIQQYHKEETLAHNLTEEQNEYREQMGISVEEWNNIPDEAREQKLYCMI